MNKLQYFVLNAKFQSFKSQNVECIDLILIFPFKLSSITRDFQDSTLDIMIAQKYIFLLIPKMVILGVVYIRPDRIEDI